MPSLIYRADDGSAIEFPLQPGITRIGRAEESEIRLFDSSASTHHCEVRYENGIATAHDLGSTNGISLNGEPVQDGVLRPGSILAVGNNRFEFRGADPGEAPVLAAPVELKPGGWIPCANHPGAQAEWKCSKCGAVHCKECIVDGRKYGVPSVKFCPVCSSRSESLQQQAAQRARQERSFWKELGLAWAYPFQGNGAIILIAGTVFFALAGFSQRFMFLLSFLIFILTTGYLAAYSQKVVTSSAEADDEPPGWPDVTDFLSDIVGPFLQAIGMFALYLLPFLVAVWKLPEGEPVTYLAAGGLLLLALFMMPMAWLAVSMHDSMVGLSPHFVIPSILRIPGQYLVVFVELAVLVGINMGLGMVLEKFQIPILSSLLNSFLGLYFMMVISRLLGVLYYVNRSRLGWF